MSVVFVKCYFYVDVSNCRWEEREAFLIFKIFISFLLSAFVFSTGLTIVISYSLKNTQKYIYSSSHLFSLLHLSTNSCWQQSRWREVFFFCFLQAEETEKERKEGLERRPVFCLKKTSLFWYGGQVAPLRTATHAVCAAPARRRENGRRGWKFKEISAAPDWPHLKFNLELRGPDLSLSCVLWSSGLLTFPDASDRSSRNLKQEVKIHKNTVEEMNQTKDQMFFCTNSLSLTCAVIEDGHSCILKPGGGDYSGCKKKKKYSYVNSVNISLIIKNVHFVAYLRIFFNYISINQSKNNCFNVQVFFYQVSF